MVFDLPGGGRRLIQEADGYKMTICAGEWTATNVAQLRYQPGDGMWVLYAATAERRWRRYEFAEPRREVDEHLIEIGVDPTGIFWG